MKKRILAIIITASFFSCNGDIKVDEKKLDAAGKDIQKDVKKGVDTVASKLKKLKNKLDDDHKTKNAD